MFENVPLQLKANQVVKVRNIANDLGILSAIGGTPTIQLGHLFPARKVYAKLEFLNPGGSSKDRAALRMIEEAIKSGAVTPGTTIIESSSGNMGIGLAQVCCYLKLKFICVVDSRTSSANINLMRAYGADVIVVSEPHPDTGDLLDARIQLVKELLEGTKDSWRPDQYNNVENKYAHYYGTAKELVNDLGRAPDAVFCPTSTCGTISGVVEYLDSINAPTKVYAVDAVGSKLFSDVDHGRKIPGLGSSRKSVLVDSNSVIPAFVTDGDCVNGCRLLAKKEAIIAGGSSGGVVMACLRSLDEISPKDSVALILPDRGERYIDTVYSDSWVSANVGDERMNLEAN